ncbi:MAG: metallophosphoesterase [Methylococcaceae bacterium]
MNKPRRTFMKQLTTLGAAATLPVSLVEIVWGKTQQESFTFAYISDSHLNHVKGAKFTRNFDNGLSKAVFEANLLRPKPDFVIYGGDLAQLGKREEIDHGLEIMSGLNGLPVRWVIGEHDYYLDMGQYWQDKVSELYYSFDHKGVHFVVLNSILTHQKWIDRWPTAMDRMLNMARLDNPEGSPFMVGDSQLAWLNKDLAGIRKDTPIVVLSHSPLYKVFQPWNFWTDDAEKVQALLRPFKKVTVLHGHVHQVMYNQIGNISFYAMMSTAWPWPYPPSYTQKPSNLPKLTIKMNRADPFNDRDATGWSTINTDDGYISNQYRLWENQNRVVKYSKRTGRPEDADMQSQDEVLPPQQHY